jgi:hypothetical protein
MARSCAEGPQSGITRTGVLEVDVVVEHQHAFDELARLMDAPRYDLAWHYEVGLQVRRL